MLRLLGESERTVTQGRAAFAAVARRPAAADHRRMTTDESGHWLHRFTPDEWLRAGRHELALCLPALAEGQQKRGVALARRAAGMALNGVLALEPDDAWGRSYMDHLRAVAHAAQVPEAVRKAAQQLVEAPLEGPRFVRIGGGADEGVGAAAAAIIEWSESKVRAMPTA